MASPPPDTDGLLRSVAQGDERARGPLLERHAKRLKQMIALRLDPRVRARVDPSDVLQESLAEADRKLSDYARDRPLPFYPWLRQIALEHLIRAHRRHLHAAGRTVRREQALPPLSGESAALLAERLAARGSGPGSRLERSEERARVQAGLALLGEDDREVLVMRYLEGLSVREVAAVLGLSESAVKMRQLRALQRLRDVLDEDAGSQP